jgi:tRNA(fMet)-specific endonuclease VapC
MIYLLDTDTTILMMRGLSILEPKSDKQRQRQETGRLILSKCKQHAEEGHEIGLSAITVAELEYGVCEADDPVTERSRLQRVLAPFVKFDFQASESARRYGQVRHDLEAKGKLIGPNDLLIAAHALALSARLVTNNLDEFRRVDGLRCESWASCAGR